MSWNVQKRGCSAVLSMSLDERRNACGGEAAQRTYKDFGQKLAMYTGYDSARVPPHSLRGQNLANQKTLARGTAMIRALRTSTAPGQNLANWNTHQACAGNQKLLWHLYVDCQPR